jgi:hypothetical protein
VVCLPSQNDQPVGAGEIVICFLTVSETFASHRPMNLAGAAASGRLLGDLTRADVFREILCEADACVRREAVFA